MEFWQWIKRERRRWQEKQLCRMLEESSCKNVTIPCNSLNLMHKNELFNDMETVHIPVHFLIATSFITFPSNMFFSYSPVSLPLTVSHDFLFGIVAMVAGNHHRMLENCVSLQTEIINNVLNIPFWEENVQIVDFLPTARLLNTIFILLGYLNSMHNPNNTNNRAMMKEKCSKWYKKAG